MKKVFYTIGGVLVLSLILIYCKMTAGKPAESITIVGSTALQPLIEEASEQYCQHHANTFINVQGGGTGTGLSQIQEGTVDVGNSDLFAEDKKGINPHKLIDHKIAVVGITPIVNKDIGITNISMTDLAKVFTGEITNWRQLGGKDMPIILINRAAGSGTRSVFEQIVLKGKHSKQAQEQDSSGMVRQIVAATPGAISYMAFSYVNRSVRALTINHVAPTDANVKTNQWPIWSYEHMYTQKHPQPLTRDFINYILSSHVQNTLVKQLGYIPIAQMQVQRDANGKIISQ